MSDKEPHEKSIFLEAIDIASVEDRAAYLQTACAGNDALRHEIDSLLRAHARPQRLLDAPDLSSPTLTQSISEKPGAQIGPYKLLREVGQGGMGVVYLAEQHEPVRRHVALKIIKPGMDTSQVIARFEAERQALSLMDHPNIARVLDAGTTETGRPYFVMELVKGVPITQYCDENHLTPKERLQLFVPVCQAVQHAHQKGIIHRDIKPSNVMVALYDDRPVPKIIDFGVAKATSQQLTENTILTQFGQVVGTIEYMSPEQANLNRLDVDTRSDIYSLGVLLYELLTGETPLDRQRLRSAVFDELMRIVREEEPPRPSVRLSTSDTLPSIAAHRHIEPKKLIALIRGDLDWIVMKAIEKDRTRRYETANGLAMDIQRYLDVEPVAACPPSFGYRLRKTLRRHRTATAVVAGFVFLLVTGAATSTYFALQASARAQEAEANAAASARNADYAKKNLGKARAAVDRLLSRVATTRLGDNPQTLNLKLQLLEDTTQFHEEFMQGADRDPFLRQEAAVSRAQLAWAHYVLGSRDEAETHIRRAVTMLEAVVRDNPRDHDAGWSLAKRRVEFYWYLRDAGDLLGAEEQIRGSATLAERLYQDSPMDAQAEILVTARIHMVELLTIKNQLEEAETWARQAVHLAQQDKAVTTYTRGSALQYLGQTLEKRNPVEAEATYEEARLTFEECIRRNEEVQASLEGREDLIGVLRSQSRLASQAGNQERAYELLIEARGLVERLAHDYPQFPWYGKLLGETQQELAQHAAAQREPEAADAWLRRTSEQMASLSRSHPEDKDYVRRAFDSHVALVRLWWAADNQEKAAESLRELVKFLDGCAADPVCVQAIPDELAALCVALGAVAEEIGDFEVVGLALGQAEQFGSDTADRRFRIAEACLAAGIRNMDSNTVTAVKFLEMAITHAERLTRDTPDDARYTQLAQSLQRAAESAWRTQNWREGADAARRAVEAYRKLPASSSEAREGLAWSLHLLGYGLRVTGHPGNAEPPQREAIESAKALVAEFPGNSAYRQILAKSYADMSHALMELDGREDEAAEHHRQSIAVWEQIVAAPNAPTYYWREYIGVLQWWGRCLRGRQPAQAATAYAAATSAAAAGYERFNHVDQFRDPYAECLLEAGNVYREVGEPAKALDSFTRAVELRPDEPAACDALSAMLADGPDETERDPKRATDLARKAIERDPQNGKYRGTLGAAMLRAGDPKTAVTELIEALKPPYASGRDLLYLAMAHWQLGEKEKARKIFDQAVAWIDEHASQDRTLARIRAEAEELLEIPSPDPPGKPEPGAVP